MTYSPFEVSRAIGANIGGAFKAAREESALDNILQQAAKTQDPNQFHDIMGQILKNVAPEKQQAALQIIEGKMKGIKDRELEQKKIEDANKNGYSPYAPPQVQAAQVKAKAGGFQPKKNLNAPGEEFLKSRGKQVADFYSETSSMLNDALAMQTDIQQAKQAIAGNVQGPGFMAAAKNSPYMSLIVGLTPDESILQGTNKKFLEGTKGLFGPKPTEREIFLLLNDMLPSIGKTKEANMASLGIVERVNNLKIIKGNIVNELTENGTKFVPDLEAQVSKQLEPYFKDLKEKMLSIQESTKSGKQESSDLTPSQRLIEQARKSREQT